MHGGARHLTLRQEGGESLLVPEWMTQSDIASVRIVESPCISVAQLRALRAFLDSILASPAGKIVPGKGGADGETLDPAAKGSLRTPPSVNRSAAIERRKALELLQALLGEAINAPQERKAEKPLEARDDKNIA
jgi:hypothetical protein